jgi:hypothetical protein
MFFEMMCNCSATFQVDTNDEHSSAVWLMANRFATAHTSCGFMTPVITDEPEKTKRYEITERQRENE